MMEIGFNWGVLRVAVVVKGIVSANEVAFQLLISSQRSTETRLAGYFIVNAGIYIFNHSLILNHLSVFQVVQ